MTDDDIKRARALVSDLQRSSLFQTRLAGDTIAALLAERERLIAALEVVPGPITQEDLDWGVAVHFKEAMQEIDVLKAERDALEREVAACASALPGPYYMDPPDGGGVSISEQLKRMARDAERYVFVRDVMWHNHEHPCWREHRQHLDAAIDAAMNGASDEA